MAFTSDTSMPDSWMSGGHEVHALRVVQDALARAQRLIHQDAAHCVRQRKGQLVRLRLPRLMVRLAWGSASTSSTFFSGLRQPDA